MSNISQNLIERGFDPFLVGLIAGCCVMALLFFLRKFFKLSVGLTTERTLGESPLLRTGTSFSTSRRVTFNMHVNGNDYSLSDTQAAAVLSEIKAGNRQAAVDLIQRDFSVSPDVAKRIVEAIAGAHIN